MNEKDLYFRESLDKLETIKDKIVNFWHWQTHLDEAKKSMWMGDAQEIYYQLFTAWDLQQQDEAEKNGDYNAIQLTLATAKSRLEQVLSELNSVSDERAIALQQELSEAFEQMWKPLAIESGLKELFSRKQLQQPSAPVVKMSEREFHLPCALCGVIAFIFRIGKPHHSHQERLIYKGLSHTGDTGLEHVRPIFAYLEQKNLSAVHRYLKERGIAEGIDAYCPECGRVYCTGHYWLKEVWEEGFYDRTLGTCPAGHQRVIDD